MNKNLHDFVKDKGRDANRAAIERYKSMVNDFDDSWHAPMSFASGFTAARLAKSISSEWISPLKRQARLAGVAAIVSLACLVATMFFAWSLVSFSSFAQFLVAFAPAVAALLFSAAKSYKTWAEARKHLAEAQAIAASAPAGSE